MKFEIYYDVANEWRWRLIATNGNIIATAHEGYKNSLDCKNIILNIKGGAHIAPIEIQD